MAQTLQLGRIGISIDVDDPDTFRWITGAGEKVLSLSGDFFGASLAETTWFRDQMADYGTMVGHVIPITWTGSTSIDGYYKIKSVDIDLETQTDQGVVRWNGEFEYLGSVNDVDFQSKLIISLRTNEWTMGTATYNPTWQPPLDSDLPDDGFTEMTEFRTYIGCETDTASAIVGFDLSGSEDVDPIWTCAPENFYSGACQIYSDGRPLVGLHAPPDMIDDWRLSNGQIQVTPDATKWLAMNLWDNAAEAYNDEFLWEFLHHDGVDWEVINDPEYVAIIRNDPEVCILRFSGPGQFAQSSRFTIDITLRRGALHAEFWVRGFPSDDFRISSRPNVAATAGTGNLYKTTNTTEGNRWVIGFAENTNWTRDVVNGIASYADGGGGIPDEGISFFIGINKNGTTPVTGRTPWDITRDYMALVYERTQPILR